MPVGADGRGAARCRLALVLGVVVLVSISLASLVAGTAALGMRDSLRALAALLVGGDAGATATLVLLGVRVPRVVSGACCGAALSCAGLLLQASLDNDLASPGVMGVNSGAGLFWLVAALLLPGHPVARQAMAFAGALVSTLLVYLVSRRAGSSRGTVVLAGVAVSSLMSAGIDAVVTIWPESVADRVAFTLGGLSGQTFQRLALSVPAMAAALVAGAVLGRGIDLLALGDETAHGLGLNVRTSRLGAIVCAAVLAASAVSVCGLLGFVGLIVPNLVRMWAGPATRPGLALCAVWGAAFLVACDLVARTVAFPYELPVGLVLSLLGAPFFISLLVRRGRGRRSHSVAAPRGGDAA